MAIGCVVSAERHQRGGGVTSAIRPKEGGGGAIGWVIGRTSLKEREGTGNYVGHKCRTGGGGGSLVHNATKGGVGVTFTERHQDAGGAIGWVTSAEHHRGRGGKAIWLSVSPFRIAPIC